MVNGYLRYLAVGARIVVFPGHLVHFAVSDPLEVGDREDFEIRHSVRGIGCFFCDIGCLVWYMGILIIRSC